MRTTSRGDVCPGSVCPWGCQPGVACLPREGVGGADTPSREQNDRQTGVKILPCPKHHLWAVNISLSLSLGVNCLQSAVLLVQ